MSERDASIFLHDIIEAIERTQRYVAGKTFEEFRDDTLATDAVLRNLEVIGEAVKRLPAVVKERHPEVEWQKIAGLRDVLIHAYFGIDYDIIWNVIQEKLPQLQKQVQTIAAEENGDVAHN